ncbi:glycoside hydrolase family 43 protein [Sphingobacterium arenae]|uniref:Glycoside hydrolase 43 family protein n=1 Tax=Sphingobacterium arenae TaxID=1280598 RepID=A0ABR7XYF0_9SPHI|nr:glycoside hydrolase 43 family protein [Sphingobacterium arenae]MBD1424076.1 glycoside hydrolase 43 family protein [Sphingobacterium arenae]
MNKFSILSLAFVLSSGLAAFAQSPYVSSVWVADLGDGRYQNPILHADYSDPDAIRVGDDFYMTASSFNHAPGLPVLHSKDLVNWKIVSHALPRQIPEDVFRAVQHGNGVWAPAIRYHENEFYIYWGDPDFGIYMVKTENPSGDWSEPVLVFEGKGLIDPCPFWDEDGNNYLSFAYAGSRAGLKSVVAIARLNATGSKVLDRGVIVYDGHEDDPTIEGTKMHKRNGYYYLFAPAGGVATGWQLVLRSKNIYGPYERHVAMHQGSAATNGPHQGAWIDTQTGEDWFIHFQDKDAYGRIVHLQPMKWVNDWPVIGVENDIKGTGEPVLTYKKPNVGKTHPVETPAESDEFDTPLLGKQWQWQANPDGTWLMPSKHGHLTLYTQQVPETYKNLLDISNVLTQKFPAEEFMATTKMRLIGNEKVENERAGFAVVGEDYSQLYVKQGKGKQTLHYARCEKGLTSGKESVTDVIDLQEGDYIYLRVKVNKGAICQWSYSLDGKKYTSVGEAFTAQPGKWIGATLGLYAIRDNNINDSGYAEFDWFRVEPLK